MKPAKPFNVYGLISTITCSFLVASCLKLHNSRSEDPVLLQGPAAMGRSARAIPRPQLLEKTVLQKHLLAPLGVKPFQLGTRRPVVTKAALIDSVAKQIKKDPSRSRQYWQESVAIALSQVELDKPTPPAKIITEAEIQLEKDPQLKKPENRHVADEIRAQLKKIVDADDLNVFANSSETTYIAANRLLDKEQTIPLGKFAGPLEGFNIEISPKDVLKAYLLKCNQGLCQASVVKPVTFKRSFPIGLNANVDIVFTQATDPKTSELTFELSVDGQWKPINLGSIVAVSLGAGFDVDYVPKTRQLTIRNPRCSVDVSCNFRLAAFTAGLSKEGLTFDATVPTGTIGEELKKLAPHEGHYKKTIPLDGISDAVQKTIKKLPHPTGEEDIFWSELVEHKNAHPDPEPSEEQQVY